MLPRERPAIGPSDHFTERRLTRFVSRGPLITTGMYFDLVAPEPTRNSDPERTVYKTPPPR